MFIPKSTSLTILAATAVLISHPSQSSTEQYIAPPMVNIPEGEFFMGSNDYDKEASPMHRVKVNAFQMAKYPVTVAEFRKFIEHTGYKMNTTCRDHLDENWLSGPNDTGNASWDKHRYLESEYMPVTCVTWQEAHAYIDWLSEQTGKPYRLPTEQEWEYAAKANTTSRYFWGDDLDMTQVCQYANVADHAGEYFASTQYGASYIGFIGHANCNDGEPYNSIVGLYRPNPFGLYDMIGNVSEYLASCFYEGYESKEVQDMDLKTCERIAHRGSSWHYPPQPHASRGRVNKNTYGAGALMGFRLAMNGHNDNIQPSTQTFEAQLTSAQAQRLQTRPAIPASPKHLQLLSIAENKVRLSWQPSDSKQVTGYEIYQSTTPYGHLIGQYFKRAYHLIDRVDSQQHSIELNQSESGLSYRVVAITAEQSSLPSHPIGFTQTKRQKLPGKLEVQHSKTLKNVFLAHRKAKEDRPELFFLSRVNKGFEQPLVTSTMEVEVEKSGWYWVNYRGRSYQNGPFFKLWQNDRFLADIDYNPDIDDKTSKRHKVYLEQGQHELEISFKVKGFDYWSFVWLEFTPIEAENSPSE